MSVGFRDLESLEQVVGLERDNQELPVRADGEVARPVPAGQNGLSALYAGLYNTRPMFLRNLG